MSNDEYPRRKTVSYTASGLVPLNILAGRRRVVLLCFGVNRLTVRLNSSQMRKSALHLRTPWGSAGVRDMWRHRAQQRSTPVKREAVIAGLASEGLALILGRLLLNPFKKGGVLIIHQNSLAFCQLVCKTTTLPAVRALPDNCSCVHLLCCRRPASLSLAWNRPELD